MPPNPTMATFSVSLGAWNPGPPRTWRGTIIGAGGDRGAERGLAGVGYEIAACDMVVGF